MSKIKRVLIVDDDDTSNFFTKSILKLHNKILEITIRLNGKEAIDYLESNQNTPDIIFLDINMPLINGFEFLDWQSNSPFKEIQVVMFSTSNREEDITKSERHRQVIDYIEKPLGIDQIKSILG